MRAWILPVLFAVLLALGAQPPAQQLPPCPTEDSTGCYWDADTMGNGTGRSFTVDTLGNVTYTMEGQNK